MTRSPGPILPRRLADQVIGELKSWFEREGLTAGSKLPTETQLMEQFGVGRSTIREAVRALVHEGLVDVRAGDGTYLKAPTASLDFFASHLERAHIAEVYEVRRTFEMGVARLAALRRTADDIVKIEQALNECRDSLEKKDFKGFLKADFDFHVAVAAATKNKLLSDLYEVFRRVFSDAMAEELFDTREGLKNVLNLHDHLMNAIKAGDVVAAQNAWINSPNPFEKKKQNPRAKTKRRGR